MVSSLRIGCVKYLNARPLVHGWKGDVIFDHPSTLCAQLARGELDVALVSSFEFLRNSIYKIVDDVAIASDGPVYSVIVAHRQKFTDVRELQIDSASATSGNLLRCLLGEMNLSPRIVQGVTPGDATRLLIGDQAIRFREERAGDFQFFDLGENWKKITGLPFVYALWLIRPEVADPKSIANELRALRDRNVAQIGDLIAEERQFDRAFCDRYYREHLRFNFGEREKRGLRKFAELCQKHELLPKREIAFCVV